VLCSRFSKARKNKKTKIKKLAEVAVKYVFFYGKAYI
jgi:hypothetical protein